MRNSEFHEAESGRIAPATNQRRTTMPNPKPTAPHLRRLVESQPSEAEKGRLAADYVEDPGLFESDVALAFADAFAAQRSVNDGGLEGWVAAIERGPARWMPPATR